MIPDDQDSEAASPAGASSGLERWALPGVAFILFLLTALEMFAASGNFITDPGTARHLYVGRLIWEGGALVTTDPFGWERPARPWIDFEWGFEVLAEGLRRLGGLGLAYGAGYVIFALIPVVLWRHLMARRVSWPVALAFVILAALTFRIHLLFRPLLVTYVLMACVVLTYFSQRRKPSAAAWVGLPLAFAVWANIHGGFAAALIFLAAAWLGRWLDRWGRGARPLVDGGLRRWALLGAACGAATLMNPHGIGLHGLILEMVFRIRSFRHWDEFLPPDFAGPSAAAIAVLVVVLTLLISRAARSRPRLPWEVLLPVLVFLWFSLKVQRHVLLLLLVAALPVSRDWEAWVRSWQPRLRSKLSGFQEMERASRSHWVWIPAAALVMLVMFAGSEAASRLRVGEGTLTPEAVEFLRSHAPRFRRPLTSTWKAGALAYYFAPQIQVSHDDRTEFYGDARLTPFINLLHVGPGWRRTLDAGGYDSAILERGFAITQALETLPDWEKVYEDKSSVFFIRRAPDAPDSRPDR